MSLYDQLTLEEKAFHDALVNIAREYGPFDQGASSIWVGYESAEDNEDKEIGVKCSNCSMYANNGDCMILSYKVEEGAKCRLAAIPDGLVKPEMEDDDEEDEEEYEKMEMSKGIWSGRFDPLFKRMV